MLVVLLLSTLLIIYFSNGLATAAASEEQQPIVVGCEKLRNRPQSIPDQQFWIQMRDAYVSVMGDSDDDDEEEDGHSSTIDWPMKSKPKPTSIEKEDDDDKNNNDNDMLSSSSSSSILTGMEISYEIQILSQKGRSVITKQFVPKGTKVWNAKYHAMFLGHNQQSQFKQFLSLLTWEQACDALQWCYAIYDGDYEDEENEDDDDEDDDDDEIGVACVLDEGSLFNHGNGDEANVGYHNPHTDDDVIALRDIQIGEELVQDYDTFDEDLVWFENLIRIGWKDDEWTKEF